MAIKIWNATGLTGGTTTDLDAISVNSISNGDRAICSYSGGLFILQYDATSTSSESSPNVVIPDDNSSGVGAWELLSINQASDTLESGVILTGGIYGLDYSRTGDNEVTVTAGNCRDATNSVWMSASSSQTVDTSGETTANQVINLFLCSDGTVRYDTDVTGATALSAYTKRWIGWVKNNSSGVLVQWYQSGDFMSLSKMTEAIMASFTTGYTQVDFSAVLPESRIKAIEYGTSGSSADHAWASEDGVNMAFYIGRADASSSATTATAWGDWEYQKSSLKPYNPDRYFRGGTTSSNLLMHSVLMHR